jgi:hypothetical protein
MALTSTALILVTPALRGHLDTSAVSYVAVGWLGAIVGDGLYWLIVLVLLSFRTLRCAGLELVWHSPASTPGLVLLSEGYRLATIFTTGNALISETLALLVPGDKSAMLAALRVGIPIAAVAAAIAAGVLPHLVLFHFVRDARQRVLRELIDLVGPVPANRTGASRAEPRVSLYRLVEASPGLPFSTAAILAYATTLLGSLVAFLLALATQ